MNCCSLRKFMEMTQLADWNMDHSQFQHSFSRTGLGLPLTIMLGPLSPECRSAKLIILEWEVRHLAISH